MKFCRALVFLLLASLPAFGQTNDPAKVKRLSLEDCIELALKHNLDLQIDRYNPEISLYSLQADYSSYDPVLSLSYEHEHGAAGVQLLSGGFTIPGSQRLRSAIGVSPDSCQRELYANGPHY
jgi:outer membrane protein TolC